MRLSDQKAIGSLNELKIHLQYAIGLELTTIPLYLTAWYSIPDGENTAASEVLRSIVMEEMLHMALAANVLNGIGGAPSTSLIKGSQSGDPIPVFPAKVKFLDGLPTLPLQRFSPEAIDIFMAIEHPKSKKAVGSGKNYGSIGAFYDAIIQGIKVHCSADTYAQARESRAGCQIGPEQYYGGAGALLEVLDAETAIEAIDRIVAEGEGSPSTNLSDTAKKQVTGQVKKPGFASVLPTSVQVPVIDGDILPGGWQMYSHYARFKEIKAGQRFFPDQKIKEVPKGSVLPVDWTAVYPMAPDPSFKKYARTEVAEAVARCNQTYTTLINSLYSSFNGEHGQMQDAVTTMYDLKYQALALMKTPSPLKKERGMTVGPSFEYQRKMMRHSK